jgi:hypothetical protein
MRISWKWALVLAVPTVCVAAEKSDDSMVPDGTTLELVLLRQKSVQQDLKLAPEVAAKVTEFTNKESDEYGKALKLSGAERGARVDELEKANKKFLEDNLSEAQRKRLHQIALQVTGVRQLNRPEVIKLLNLTDEQQKTFKEMQQEARKAFAEIMTSKEREGKNQKLAKLREALDKKIEAVLTDEQKAKAKEYVGEPFKGEIVFEEDSE